MAKDNVLEELGEAHRPSKRNHNYLPYYWMHLRDIREQVTNVPEIGVQTDCSMKMWEDFFPIATIHGLDIDQKCKALEGGRRRVHIGDQGDTDFLRRLADAVGPLDVIIDDGSHRPDHQLSSFEALFPLLSDHGIYVMEDTGGVVGDEGLRTVRALQSLVPNVMHWPAGVWAGDWPSVSTFGPEANWADKNIIGVAFYRWIVFVMRGHNPGDNPYLGPGENR